MNRFNVYANRQGTYEAVKRGWSWPAFFFVFLWALVNRLWAKCFFAVAWIVLFVVFVLPAAENREQARVLTNIGGCVMGIVFEANGNKWRETSIKWRRFHFKNTVRAEDEEAACWIVRRRIEEELKGVSDIRAGVDGD